MSADTENNKPHPRILPYVALKYPRQRQMNRDIHDSSAKNPSYLQFKTFPNKMHHIFLSSSFSYKQTRKCEVKLFNTSKKSSIKLMKLFARSINLTKLSIQLFERKTIGIVTTKQLLTLILLSISRLKRLRSLELNIQGDSWKGKPFMILINLIKKISSLQNIRLEWNWPSLSDKHIQILSKHLAKIPAITLKITESQLLTVAGLEILSEELSKSQKLKSFGLALIDCGDISGNPLNKFTSSLGEIKNLESIKLQLDSLSPHLLIQGVLAEQLPRLQHLKYLGFSFPIGLQSQDPFQNNLCPQFLESLPRIKSLRKLDFNFFMNQSLQKTHLEILGKALCEMERLEELSLNFGFCSLLIDGNLLKLGEYLKRLTNLRYLNVNLDEIKLHREPDECLPSEFIEQISRLPNLESLSLSLNQVSSINHRELARIGMALVKVSNLKQLDLSLNYVDTDPHSIQGLIDWISYHKLLETLNLSFMNVDFERTTRFRFANFPEKCFVKITPYLTTPVSVFWLNTKNEKLWDDSAFLGEFD